MDRKKQRISIQLSVEQTRKYFEVACNKTAAEIDEDCLPSGVTLKIEVAPPFGTVASVDGEELGLVDFDIVDIE